MPAQPVGRSKDSTLALFSLLVGILGFCLWIFGAIPAIILGIVALAKISATQGLLRGKGLATRGIVTGGFGWLFAWLFWIIVAATGYTPLGMAGFAHSHQLAQAGALIHNARQIDAAIDPWALENGMASGPVDCAEVAKFLKPGELQDKVAVLGNRGGKIESMLNIADIAIGSVVAMQVTISPEAKQALPAVHGWGLY
jgi:hypothetical protein